MDKRYVDDTVLVFNDRDDCELFLEFFNHRHLPFLDVLVTRNTDGEISTSVFHKKKFQDYT